MFGPLIGYFCTACAALTISGGTLNVLKTPVGSYVDDTTPHECQVVTEQRLLGASLIIAAQAPYSHLTCAGALTAKEWYPPYGSCRYRSLRRPPRARAYILQRRFAWPGCKPPSARQRRRILGLVKRKHPLFVFWN